MQFKCGNCGKLLEAKAVGGEEAICPYCQAMNSVPIPEPVSHAPMPEPVQSAPRTEYSSPNLGVCRDCGGRVSMTAPACPHCGAQNPTRSGGSIAKPAADYGIILLAIPVAATLLVWFWVSRMNLAQSPGSTMGLIDVATVLGTATVAAMEAGKAGMKSDRKKGTYSPIAWFFIIALLWIIGYPLYLFKRKHFGLANLLVAGTLVALMAVGSLVIMGFAIEARTAELRGNLEQMQRQLESLGK